MSDTPCVDGCGQDAATIERLRERAEKAEAAIERARHALDIIGVLHPVAADRVQRALDGPLAPAEASQVPQGGPGATDAGEGRF